MEECFQYDDGNVVEVITSPGAAQTGLLVGDKIVEFAGRPCKNTHIETMLGMVKGDVQVKITVERKKKKLFRV